jgi:hypothetical protein
VAYGKLRRIFIVEGGYKRELEPVTSPQSTILHSTGNTSVKEGSQPQQHTWNSKALFFPAEITAAHSLHFQHLMWITGFDII